MTKLKMFVSLSFLSIKEVTPRYDLSKINLLFLNIYQIRNFFIYFDSNFIGVFKKNNLQRAQKYKISCYNCNVDNLSNLPKKIIPL